MIKILFTTPILEHPPVGGPQLRIENSIKALNLISELHVISRVPMHLIGGVDAEIFYRSISNEFGYSPNAHYCSSNLFEKIANYRFKIKLNLINKFLNLPFKSYNRIYNSFFKKNKPFDVNEDADYIIKYVNNNNIDIIWFGYGNISYELMKSVKLALPHVKMVCDTDSVWSRFVLRELDVEDDPHRRQRIEEEGRKKEVEEKDWAGFMDVTTAVSEVDAEYYRSIATDKNRIHVFSNVIDTDTYKGSYIKPEGFKRPCIYLAGSFGHDNSPMDRAAMWVVEEIYPIVKKSMPEISFYIIGRNSERLIGRIDDDSIRVIGKVDSVLPYLCNADVSLVPLKFESGTRFKILEAGACGIPIVSTTLGAEGIPLTHNFNILIADTPEDFANAIIRLIKDEKFAQFLARNCKKLIEENYSVNYLVKEGQDIIKFLKQ
ncbi:MAG: hypothetical protein CVV49_03540 [Spirochaetae bacterium HGW-Spirochaetae-5]|nr:MAG: hypothetical protein CVV49_03540 [Spirochaetae bacterium HGW-Spirochaetae-5]